MNESVTLLNTVKSKQDATVKYVVSYADKTRAELSYINKNDGKIIICAPTETSCRMGCSFCYLTTVGDKLKYRSLNAYEMTDGVLLAIKESPPINSKLLVSFMGSGEPLMNWQNMLASMRQIKSKVSVPARFAFATSLPKNSVDAFLQMTRHVADDLDIKAHLSLHFTNDEARKKYMPASLDIATSINLLELYKNLTKRRVEAHYTLIDGVNDSPQDALTLRTLLAHRDIPLKLLYYSENPVLGAHRSTNVDKFMKLVKAHSLEVEFYEPPGQDIGSSCGQFFIEEQEKK